MPTYSPSRRVARTGRPLGMLDVLSKVLDTGLAALGEWAQARRAAQLVALLRILDVPAYYAGRTYTGNFAADDREGMWYEAEHGSDGTP